MQAQAVGERWGRWVKSCSVVRRVGIVLLLVVYLGSELYVVLLIKGMAIRKSSIMMLRIV